MLRRAAISFAVLVLAVFAGIAATSSGLSHIVDIRIGKHPDYDRLVIELERAAAATRPPITDLEAFVLELAARPLLATQTLETGLKRMGTVTIEATELGTRISLEPRLRRVRVFYLDDPPRIVVDLADPGPEPFEAPAGVEAVLPLEAEPLAEVEAVEPNTAAEISEVTAVSEPEPVEPQSVEPQSVEPQSVEPESVEPQPVEPEPVKSQPKSEPYPEFSAPQTDAGAEWSESLPATGAGPAWLPAFRLSFAAALILGLVSLGIVGLVWLRLRRPRPRRTLAHERAALVRESSMPETITPDEIVAESDRIDILDKRIDEEVRARMQLEERLAHSQEELKVVRDRLYRLTRRSEGDA